MRLIVTGASGYVGASVVRRAPHAWTIAATYLAHPIEQPNAAAFRVDVRDRDAVDRLFGDFRPEVVIHTAALMSGAQMMATNGEGTRWIAQAAASYSARLIHLSSDVIFDGEHAPYSETAAAAPITPYAESKAMSEKVVAAASIRSIIVRTSLVYGFTPMDPRTRQTLAGEMPRLFTDEYRCPILVDDLADALIELAGPNPLHSEGAGPMILNVAGPQRLSRYKFGLKLAKAFSLAPRFQPALSVSSPVPRPRDCTLDITKAQKILQAQLRGVDQVLNDLTAPILNLKS